ncbi:right-handed parallel beta-helix repeat-containing protein [Roseimaritima ulvae]|nr:right-handed parallel beta-helix repeat-containing protein [Roseimaritima ulvae]
MVACSRGLGAEAHVYVASGANTGGNGSRAQPFVTLHEAREAIAAARKADRVTGKVTVHVANGVYPLDTSFALGSDDSGTAESPIEYRSVEPGGAHLRGGITLQPSGFQAVSDAAVLERLDPAVRRHVRVYDLSEAMPESIPDFKVAFRGKPRGPWLYVDGQPMTLARWPNRDAAEGGWAGFTKALDTGLPDPGSDDPAKRKAHPGSFEFKDPRPARWNLDKGVWLQGYWTHDWSDEVIRVASYDADRHAITLAAPHNYGIMGGTWGAAKRRFFALNSLDELDAAGEWYLDRSGKRLYFYPPAALDNASIVLATVTDPLLKLSSVQHVTFSGFAIEYGHGNGVQVKESQHVQIVDCVVANLGGSGMSVNGSQNRIQGCELYNLGTSGLSLSGGDRKSLTPANNQAINNHIHHYGFFQRTYAPGIGVSGCGQVVRNNCIHDAPHNAILYGGNEHLFERNEIYRVVMETGDSGAFYTGRDWTSQGNVLRHNYIHDLGGGDASHVNTMGVYLDDCDSGDTIEGNVFYRAGRAIMIGGGRDNRVLNNLVIDCPIGLHMDARGMTWKQWNNPESAGWNLEGKAEAMLYRQPPWSERYPNLAGIMNDSPREPLHNPIRRNLFVDCTKQVCSFDGNVKKMLDKLPLADNVAVNTRGRADVVVAKDIPGFTTITGSDEKPVDIGFDAAAKRQYQLREGSRLQQQLPGFEAMPLDQIGLLRK